MRLFYWGPSISTWHWLSLCIHKVHFSERLFAVVINQMIRVSCVCSAYFNCAFYYSESVLFDCPARTTNKTLVSKQSWALRWNMISCLCAILVDVLPMFVIRSQKQRKALQQLLQATCSRTSNALITKAPQLCVYQPPIWLCVLPSGGYYSREHDEMQMMRVFTFLPPRQSFRRSRDNDTSGNFEQPVTRQPENNTGE